MSTKTKQTSTRRRGPWVAGLLIFFLKTCCWGCWGCWVSNTLQTVTAFNTVLRRRQSAIRRRWKAAVCPKSTTQIYSTNNDNNDRTIEDEISSLLLLRIQQDEPSLPLEWSMDDTILRTQQQVSIDTTTTTTPKPPLSLPTTKAILATFFDGQPLEVTDFLSDVISSGIVVDDKNNNNNESNQTILGMSQRLQQVSSSKPNFSILQLQVATTTTTTTTMIQTTIFLLFSTWATADVLSDLLANFEWVQTWRYLWPFGIGIMYILLNIQSLNVSNDFNGSPPPNDDDDNNFFVWIEEEEDVIRPFIGRTPMTKIFFFLFGWALMIGGAYDIWMPVYETGPNIVTSAGIGQDAAVGLFGGTLFQILHDTRQQRHRRQASSLLPSLPVPKDNDVPPFPLSGTNSLLYILLLAQLYKLGEGSFDELFFSHFFV